MNTPFGLHTFLISDTRKYSKCPIVAGSGRLSKYSLPQSCRSRLTATATLQPVFASAFVPFYDCSPLVTSHCGHRRCHHIAAPGSNKNAGFILFSKLKKTDYGLSELVVNLTAPVDINKEGEPKSLPSLFTTVTGRLPSFSELRIYY